MNVEFQRSSETNARFLSNTPHCTRNNPPHSKENPAKRLTPLPRKSRHETPSDAQTRTTAELLADSCSSGLTTHTQCDRLLDVAAETTAVAPHSSRNEWMDVMCQTLCDDVMPCQSLKNLTHAATHHNTSVVNSEIKS